MTEDWTRKARIPYPRRRLWLILCFVQLDIACFFIVMLIRETVRMSGLEQEQPSTNEWDTVAFSAPSPATSHLPSHLHSHFSSHNSPVATLPHAALDSLVHVESLQDINLNHQLPTYSIISIPYNELSRLQTLQPHISFVHGPSDCNRFFLSCGKSSANSVLFSVFHGHGHLPAITIKRITYSAHR